ncbi:hypothetical protein MTR72_34705 [Bradyrhizobium sp. ISRA442]|uniref:hypothetical protein n=1 Tax=unclassified Bradyrhizobium TaxID=2631580 RepID=UPI002479A991|nr:hypothetical protein [Bradyrhizobium sp. ISRA432]
MDIEYDPGREAIAAMKTASEADGAERQRWIGVATAWQEIARMRQSSISGVGTEEMA